MKRYRTTAAFTGLLGIAAALILLLGFGGGGQAMEEGGQAMGKEAMRGHTAVATFAGGCFWCMQPPFDALPGVISTTAGYTGGHVKNPTYEEVSAGGTGHAESVQVVYDPDKVSYEKLLYVFWRNVDPVTANAQFCDHGHQYRTAIFYHDEAQKEAALASKAALEKSGRLPGPIVTEIVPASTFYMAEGHHQEFYKTHPLKYKFYRFNCGRDRRLEHLWGAEAGGGHHG